MLKLTERADLGVFYDADAARYRGNRSPADVITREVFCAFYRDSPSIGFAMNGQAIGGILFDGRQAHIAVLPEYHGRWALLLKPALAWLFSLKRQIVVEVEADNTTCLRFMARHGWERLGQSGGDVLFLLEPQGGARKTEYPNRQRPK